jgi:GNAT superfamily N-acetyltransferase
MHDSLNGFVIKEMDEESFQPLFLKHSKELFDDKMQVFHLREAFNEEEKTKLKELHQSLGTPYKLRLGVFEGEKFIGWHYGYQETALKFYMCNSAILPGYRRKGLYSKLLKKALEIIQAKGFQEIYSRHMPTNNQVIIPKLKEGFMITSMQIEDIFGVLVHLTYYPKDIRKKVLDYRVGNIRADEEIIKYLKL